MLRGIASIVALCDMRLCYILAVMKVLICHLLSLLVLCAVLGWSADGHALNGEDHDDTTSFTISIDDQRDAPDGNPDAPVCDHHCHAGAHLLALPSSQLSSFKPMKANLLNRRLPGIATDYTESPYRPPSC